MKSKRPVTKKVARNLVSQLGSPKFAWALLLTWIVFSALGFAVGQESAGASRLARFYPPEILYFLRRAGLTDVLHSYAFILVVGLFGVNLGGALLARFARVWAALRGRAPTAVPMEPLFARKKIGNQANYSLGMEIPVSLGAETREREEFRKLVSKWVKPRLGRIWVTQDGAGSREYQLAASAGWGSSAGSCLFLVGSILLIASGAWDALFGFEGRITLEEGSTVDSIQVVRPNSSRWPKFVAQVGRVGSTFRPGFGMGWQSAIPSVTPDLLSFSRVGRAPVSRTFGKRFAGLRFVADPEGSVDTGRSRINVVLRERMTGEKRRIPNMLAEQSYDLGGPLLRWVELKPGQPAAPEGDLGVAARFEYRESAADPALPESFWVFRDHPAYDEFKRKKSRYIAAIESVAPVRRVGVLVFREPGFELRLASAALMLLGVLGWLGFRERVYWFSLIPGKVYVVAESRWPTRERPFFDRLVGELKLSLAGLEVQLLESTEPLTPLSEEAGHALVEAVMESASAEEGATAEAKKESL